MIAGEFVTDGRRRVAIGASIGCIAVMYLVISQSTALLYTALALAGFGFFFFVLSTVIQGLLIGSSPDEFRGRVMGLYTMVTAGGVPIAALIGGAIGSLVGPGEAVALAAIVMLALLGVDPGGAPTAGGALRRRRSEPRRSVARAGGGALPRTSGQIVLPEHQNRLGELLDRLAHDFGDRQQRVDAPGHLTDGRERVLDDALGVGREDVRQQLPHRVALGGELERGGGLGAQHPQRLAVLAVARARCRSPTRRAPLA